MDVRPVNLNEFLDSGRFSLTQASIVGFCALVAMLDGFDTQSIAYVAPVIAREWGLEISAFGPIFGAGLFGLMLGALIFGPAADRYGRKRMLVVSVVIFGFGALMTPLARSLDGLLIIRILTGVGLGGAMPNLIALTLECAPRRLRATVVTIMFCGVPLGATLGGLVSVWMIPNFGWASIFYLGGILPLVLGISLAFWLPESVSYLITAGATQSDVHQALSQITHRQIDGAAIFAIDEEKLTGASVSHLFKEGRAAKTLLVWLAFFMNLLVMYFLINWLPTLVREVGLQLSAAIFSTVLLNLGGAIGGVALGRLIDRAGPFSVLSAAYALAAVAIFFVAASAGNVAIMMSSVFLAGMGIIGAQIGMNALTAELYPTAIRSSGVGWALGVGRIGSIIGPVVGGALIAENIGTTAVLNLAAVPALVAAAAVFTLGRLQQSCPIPAPVSP